MFPMIRSLSLSILFIIHAYSPRYYSSEGIDSGQWPPETVTDQRRAPRKGGENTLVGSGGRRTRPTSQSLTRAACSHSLVTPFPAVIRVRDVSSRPTTHPRRCMPTFPGTTVFEIIEF